MNSLALRLSAALILVAAMTTSAFAASGKSTVAVLYFDNNTGDPKFDVLKKGFADMLITDLSRIPGLVIVERDKLEAILGEIKLQHSKHFDKKSAVKVGKVLGAKYTVTGSFASAKPRMRVDMRLIEVKTGRVVLGTYAIGMAKDVFTLEQKLVTDFATQLRLSANTPMVPLTKVPNLDTLLEYSKGLDKADRGNPRAARKHLDKVVSMAPTFGLARLRRKQLVKYLATYNQRKDSVLLDRQNAVLRQSRLAVRGKRIQSLGEEQAVQFLAHRAIIGRFILAAVDRDLGQSDQRLRFVTANNRVKVLAGIRAYYANLTTIQREFRAHFSRFSKTAPNGHIYLSKNIELPRELRRKASNAKITTTMSEARNPELNTLKFLLLGRADTHIGGRHFTIAPPPSVLDPKLRRVGEALIESAYAYHAKLGHNHERDAANLLLLGGQYHQIHGRTAQAVRFYQRVLDNHPTAIAASTAERKIEELAGINSDHTVRNLARWKKGLAGCRGMDLNASKAVVFRTRARIEGIQGIHNVVKEAVRACGNNPKARLGVRYVYDSAALQLGKRGDCASFERYMAKVLELGGSKRDISSYRKNHTNCPAP